MHQTFFKHQLETRHEYKARRDREKQAALDECYGEVDARDRLHSRRSGKLLMKGHTDPHQRLERHHMEARSLAPGRVADSSNVISLSGSEHAEVKAGKARYSGDANLRDADGNLCGVKYERIGEGGWYTVRLI